MSKGKNKNREAKNGHSGKGSNGHSSRQNHKRMEMKRGTEDTKFPVKLAMWDFDHCDRRDVVVRSWKDLG